VGYKFPAVLVVNSARAIAAANARDWTIGGGRLNAHGARLLQRLLQPLALDDVARNRDDVPGKIGAVFCGARFAGRNQAQPRRARGAVQKGLL